MRAINLGILLGAGIAVAAAGACTSGGDSDPATNNGSGGGTATGGGTGSGATGTDTGGSGTGTGGMGGGGSGDPDAVACPAATEAALLDFAPGMGGAGSTEDSTFGDFTETFSGGTFVYPETLTSDTSAENWHLSGDLNDYGGFGLWFASCAKVDASAFSGITFTVSGDTDGKPVTLRVATAANSKPNEAGADPTFGRCTAATCADSIFEFTPTASAETIEVSWAELTGGAPEAALNPAEITEITWFFTPPEGAGTASVTSYPVDVVIDDIGFME